MKNSGTNDRYRLPYDPALGTFRHIPTDRTAYPSYPVLLGE